MATLCARGRPTQGGGQQTVRYEKLARSILTLKHLAAAIIAFLYG